MKQQNEKTFWNKKKNTKIPKRSPAYQADVSCFNADILYSFNPELQLEDTEIPLYNPFAGIPLQIFTKLKKFHRQ